MTVQLKGNTLPAIQIIDLGVTVAFGQIIEITNLEFSQSLDAQTLVQRLLLIELSGTPQTPTVVNLSDVDPNTFNIRPQAIEMEDLNPALQEMIQSSDSWSFVQDPGFSHSPSDVISWGNGSIIYNGLVYTLASSTLTATANSLLIGTLASGVMTLSLHPLTYVVVSGQIIVGSYDFTHKELFILNGAAGDAEDVSFDPTSTVYSATNVQDALAQTSNLFTGTKTLASFAFNFGSGGLTNSSANLQWGNGTDQFTASHSAFNWHNGTTVFEVDDSQLEWTTSGGVEFVANSGEMTWESGSVQFVVNSGEIYWSDGSTTFQANDSELAWSHGSIEFVVSDSEFYYQNSGGASFEADSGGIRFFDASSPTNVLKLWAFGGSLIQTNSDLTIQSTTDNITVDIISSKSFIVTDGTFQVLINNGELFWSDGGSSEFVANTSELMWEISGTQFVVNSGEVYWSNGSTTFQSNDSELAWSHGSIQFTVSDSEFYYQNSSGANFEADSGGIRFFDSGTPANILKIWAFGGSLIQTNSDLTIKATGNSMTFAVDTAMQFIFDVNGAPLLTADSTQLFWNNGTDGFTASHTNIAWTDGTADFSASASQMVWTDNAGTSFHAAPSNLFYGNGTAVFNLANTGSAILTGDLTIQVNQLNLNGSVVQRTQSISDLAGGGDIGSAATTVDVDSSFNVAQTTAIQTITLPAPTDTTPGRFVYVNNTGTTTFTMLGKVLPNGAGLIAMWTGAAWSLMGFGG